MCDCCGPAGLPESIRIDEYDIVNSDPRGSGASTAVQCFPSAASESAFLGPYAYFPTGRGQQGAFTRRWREFGRICAARNSTLPRHLSTADSARDLNLLRQALGQPKLNYMTDYFRTGTLPPKGAVCGQNLPPFPLPAG